VDVKDYRQSVFALIPSLEVLDGKDKKGEDVLEDESESGEFLDDSEEEELLENEDDAEISEGEEEEEIVPQKRGVPQQAKGNVPAQGESEEEEEVEGEEEEEEEFDSEEGKPLFVKKL
jgi:acidic leucine-rich nuclear phosphoprotein 32 family protein B